MNGSEHAITTLELVGRWGGTDDLDESRTDLSTFRTQIVAAATLLGDGDIVEVLYDRVVAEAASARALLEFISRARVLLLGRGLLTRGSITSGLLRARRKEERVESGPKVTWHAFGPDIGRAYTLQQYLLGTGVYVPATFLRSTAESISDLIVESEFVGGAPRAFPRRYWDVKLLLGNTTQAAYENSLHYLAGVLRQPRNFGRQLVPLLVTCVRSGWAAFVEGQAGEAAPRFDEWLLSRDIVTRLKSVPGGSFPYLALLDWLLDTRRDEPEAVSGDRLRSAIQVVGKHSFLRDSLFDAPETLLGPENRIEIERILLNPGTGL